MGWRYRKRIKIFPGIYINISKNGISTNVGVKGANVTFGPNGTYVNTGIPGTGLYQRDKVSESNSISEKHDLTRDKNQYNDTYERKDNHKGFWEFLKRLFKSNNDTTSNNATDCLDKKIIECQHLKSEKSLEQSSIENKPQEVNKNSFVQKSNNVSSNQIQHNSDRTDNPIVETKEDDVPYNPKSDLENYRYPTLDLLYNDDNNTYVNEEQSSNKLYLIRLLHSFGIEISSIKETIGPRITLFELTLANGISVSKIRGLEDDIALALYSHDVHIIAPIPGKGTIGIEVPNRKPYIVSLKSLIKSKVFLLSTMDLPCAIGKTITNEIFMFDLAKTPNLLVSGSTGQGKSTLLNAIILSLLYKKHPAELKFVLMDSRGIELGLYHSLVNHFLAALPDDDPIVSSQSNAVRALRCLCLEMEERYKLFNAAEERNIKDYNQKFICKKIHSQRGHKYLPYIVVIIDDYADLMAADRAMEGYVTRLAQYGRATGIHLILTTQRPTNDVITGAIKANFPTRISFKVPEKIDSQIILDCLGAEKLYGNGDMLYRAGKTIDCMRIQCAFVNTQEIQNIVWYVSNQRGYSHCYELPINDVSYDYGKDVDVNHLDPMFVDVARMVVSKQICSTSLIQREFSFGFNRACRLVNQLEAVGIVGACQGSKPHDVLIIDESSLEKILSNL